MSIFGSSEKKVEEKTTFNFDIDKENINQSNLAKDIKINGSIEAKDYIDFAGYLTGTIKSTFFIINLIFLIFKIMLLCKLSIYLR